MDIAMAMPPASAEKFVSVLCAICAVLVLFPLKSLAANASPNSRIDADVRQDIARFGAADAIIRIKRTEANFPFAPLVQPLRGRDLAEARRLGKVIARSTGSEPYFTGFKLVTKLDAKVLEMLDADASVERVSVNRGFYAQQFTLPDAIALSGAAPSLFSPLLGSGEEVMIIEGSFDAQHPVFSSNRVIEHCFGGSQSGFTTVCTIGAGNSIERHGPGAARMALPLPSSNSPLITTASFHGASVSSIVAAANGSFARGFAPDVTIHMANVSGNTSSGWKVLDSIWQSRLPDQAIIRALDWAIAYKSTPAGAKLRAINMSFGRIPSPEDAGSETSCSLFDWYAEYLSRFNQLRALGVLPVVAAGNTPLASRHFPACVDSAFGVTMSCNLGTCPGGTNVIASDTTLSSAAIERPKLAAPGNFLSTATTKYTSSTGTGNPIYVSAQFGGTSAAAPMATACAALVVARLAAEGRSWDLPSLSSALQLGSATATRSGVTYRVPLLNCYQAYQAVVAGTATMDPNDHRLTGTYFDFSAPGQGFVFEVNPVQGTLTGGWFSNKQPVIFPQGQGQHWLSLNRVGLEGPLQHTVVMDILAQRFTNRRPLFNTTNGAATGVHQSFRIGTAKLTFRSCDTAEFSYEFDSAVPPTQNAFPQSLKGTIALQRLGVSFGCATNPKAKEGLPENPPNSTWMPSAISGIWGRAVELNGTWQFDPNYSGQGLMIDSGPSGTPYMFGGWYSYAGAFDTIGDPASTAGNIEYKQRYRWLTFVADPTFTPGTGILDPIAEPHEYTADIAITAGGTFVATVPGPIAHVVGKAKIKFHSCRRATFSYSFVDMWPPLPAGGTGSSGGQGFDGITGFPIRTVPSTWTTGSFEIIRVLADPVSGCVLP